MKKVIILILFLISTFSLMGCEKKETRNLPIFNEKSNIEEIKEKLEKKKINFEFLEFLVNEKEKDGVFLEYGNVILKNKKETAVPGSLVAEGAVVEIHIHVYSPIIISKYLQDDSGNYGIELYNLTNNDINLNEYNLTFFPKDEKKIKKENQIKLEGTIKQKDVFSISLSGSINESLKNLDQTIDKTSIGNDKFALTNKNDLIIDFFGSDGMPEIVFANRLLVRKKHADIGNLTYNLFGWINYEKNAIHIFTNKLHPINDPETFKLDEEKYKNIPFSQKGGLIKVEFISNNDGDTAEFRNIDPNQSEHDFTGTKRVRFVGVDTPEMTVSINGIRVDTKGKERRDAVAATNYVRRILENASEENKKIYLQHDMATGLRDTYGRHLSLIWVDGILLNYLIVKEGHSQNLYSKSKEKFVYEYIEMETWFQMAHDEAKALKKGIWHD